MCTRTCCCSSPAPAKALSLFLIDLRAVPAEQLEIRRSGRSSPTRPTRWSTAACACRRPAWSARRAAASGTSSTAGTPSGSCWPRRRSATATGFTGARHRITPTGARCSAARSAPTRACSSRSRRPTCRCAWTPCTPRPRAASTRTGSRGAEANMAKLLASEASWATPNVFTWTRTAARLRRRPRRRAQVPRGAPVQGRAGHQQPRHELRRDEGPRPAALLLKDGDVVCGRRWRRPRPHARPRAAPTTGQVDRRRTHGGEDRASDRPLGDRPHRHLGRRGADQCRQQRDGLPEDTSARRMSASSVRWRIVRRGHPPRPLQIVDGSRLCPMPRCPGGPPACSTSASAIGPPAAASGSFAGTASSALRGSGRAVDVAVPWNWQGS